jgi:GntR family transcriptional regulator
MTLRLTLRPGESIFDQVVFAAQKALVSREFQVGEPFPSVRALAADLNIHPSTTHKVIQHLIREGWLENHPGKGTVVATPPLGRAHERRHLLQHEVEQLAVEAKRLGLTMADVVSALAAQWNKLDKTRDVSNK